MQIFAAEINHDDIPVYLREKISGSESNIKKIISQVSSSVHEVFVLSSGNRFALYAVSETIAPLVNFFSQDSTLKGYVHFYYNTEESVTHLFATASGLLSHIKGEHQILAHIQQAHHWALECDSIGITLDNLLREAVRIGKKVRTQTAIDKFCSSVVDAGIELLYDKVEGIHKKSFLVVGTGKLARLALRYLYNEGISDVVIAGESETDAEEIADLFNIKSIPVRDLALHFNTADVIIGTCTDESLYARAVKATARKLSAVDHSRKRFILDFGVLCQFDAKLGTHASIEMYTLDDLKRMHSSPLDAFGGLEEAWSIVLHESKEFMLVLRQLELSPILAAYWNRSLDTRDGGIAVLPKLNDVSSRDIELIKKHAHKLILSISRDPFKNLHSMSNNVQAVNGLELIKKMSSFNKVKLNTSIN